MKLICPTCGASASLPLGMTCPDHQPRLVPERIQLRRTKGWRKPDNAVVVSRPSRWGNPFRSHPKHPEEAVERYRRVVAPSLREEHLSPLRGRDLACWCPLDQPCHADVLLDLANRS